MLDDETRLPYEWNALTPHVSVTYLVCRRLQLRDPRRHVHRHQPT